MRRRLIVLPALGVLVALLTGCSLLPGGGAVHWDDGGGTWSAPVSRAGAWSGYWLDDYAATPLTLKSVRYLRVTNARIADARVIRLVPSGGIGIWTPPLASVMRREVDTGRPVVGFVVPGGSRNAYELVFRIVPVDPAKRASVAGAVLTYENGGFEHTETSRVLDCLRQSPGDTCGFWVTAAAPRASRCGSPR